MRILLAGYHNPNFVNSIVFRERALISMGHELVSFDDAGFFLPGRVRDKFPWSHQWDLRRLNRNLINLVKHKRPDLCLVVGGHNILPETVSRIKSLGVPIGLWTTDAPVDFNNILESARFYDHLFCAGTEALDIFHEHGLRNTSWVPFGCEPSMHQCVPLSDEDKAGYSKDIVFVGSYYLNRAKILESVADLDVGVWGPYWSKLAADSPLKQKAVSIKMNYDQWVKIFNASKVNIVIHFQDGQTPCHQASPKVFESMACGCFVLSDRQKDVQALFKDKEHLVFFDDENDLRAKVLYYLNHPQERDRIALAGHAEVTGRHTYQERLKTILGILLKKNG
jgi:spore maturation protein CgeB